MALQRPLASDHRAAGSVNVRSRACRALALAPASTRIANTTRFCSGSHRSPAAYVRQGGLRKQLINPAAAVDAAAAAAAPLIAEALTADCLLHSGTAAADGSQHSHADAVGLGTSGVREDVSANGTCDNDDATAERWLSHSQASTSGRSSEVHDIEGMASPVQLHLAAANLPTTLYVNTSSNGNGRGRGHRQQHHQQQQQQWRWWQQDRHQQQQQQDQHSSGDGGRWQVQEHNHHHLHTSIGEQQRANSGTAAGPGRPSVLPSAAAAAAESSASSGGATGATPVSTHTGASTAAAATAAGHSVGSPWSARLLRPAAAPLRPGCACSPSHVSALAAALRVSPRAVEPLLRLQPELSAHDPASISSRVEALSDSLGCSQRQAAAMVASHPACYLQQPLEVLEGRAQQLAGMLGLSQQQVVAWAAATPSLLKRQPAVVADRVQRLCTWLDAPAADVVAAAQAAPELLTVRLAAAWRRAGLLQRLLQFKQEVQVQRLVLAAPQVLFVSPRIVLSKVRVLMGIFQKDRRAVGRLVYTTPALLTCNLNHLRTSYQQLQLRLQRSAGYVFAMCCHSAELLLQPGPRLAARVAAVCQAAALVPTWGEEWGCLKPPHMHACLAAGRGRYARLHYLLLTQQAQQVGLQTALLMPATQWEQQFPEYAAWAQAATQQQQQWRHSDYKHTPGGVPVSSSSSYAPPPAGSALTGSRAQQHQQLPPAAKGVSYQQLQQQWVQGWQTGASRHQSWSQQLSSWDRLQRARQQELRRHQQQAAWLASGEQQQQVRRASNQAKRRRDRQKQEEGEQQQQQQNGRLADVGGVARSSAARRQATAAPAAAPVAAPAAVMLPGSSSSSSSSSNGRVAKVGRTAGPATAQAVTEAPSPEHPALQHAAADTTPSSSSSRSRSSYGSWGPTPAGSAAGADVTVDSGAEGGVHTMSASSGEGSESGVGEGGAAAQALESPETCQQSVAAAEDVQVATATKSAAAGTMRPRRPSNAGVSSMGQYRAAPGRRVQGVPQQRQYGQQQQQLSVVHASHSFGLSLE